MSSQHIPGSSLSPSLQYFGRSVSARLDLDGDDLIDVAVGAQGSAVLLRWGDAEKESLLIIAASIQTCSLITFFKQLVPTFKNTSERFTGNQLAATFVLCHIGNVFKPSLLALEASSRSMWVCPSSRTRSTWFRRPVRGEAENPPVWTPQPVSQPSPAPLDDRATLLVDHFIFLLNPTSQEAPSAISRMISNWKVS